MAKVIYVDFSAAPTLDGLTVLRDHVIRHPESQPAYVVQQRQRQAANFWGLRGHRPALPSTFVGS